jgi:hypothetical protein
MRYLALLFLLLPATSYAAIGIGTSVTPKNSSGGAISQSWTMSAGSAIKVDVFAGASDTCPSTATWGSVTLVTAGKGGGAGRWSYVYTGMSGAGGTNNLVFDCSSDIAVVYGQEYTGAGGITGASGANTATASSAGSLAMSTTTTVDNSWPVMFVRADGGTASAGANTTMRLTTAGDPNAGVFDTNAAVTPAGANTLNFSVTGSRAIQGIEVIITPTVAATIVPSLLGLVRSFWIF